MRFAYVLPLSLLLACQSKPAPIEADASTASVLDASLGAVSTEDASLARKPDASAATARFEGVVRGIVVLADGSTLPLAPPPTMMGNPALSVAPCPAIDLTDQRTVSRHAETSGLSPVHVAITRMTAVPERPPRTHELFIDACRLRPTLVGAIRGDTIKIVNRSDTALLPRLPKDSYMRGLLRGESRELLLEQLGTTRLRCEFGSYCGESAVITLSHPLQAVTDEQGRFKIDSIPLDQPLTLHAWHPLFEVASAPFTLTDAAREQTLTLRLVPRPSAIAPARAPAPSNEKPRAKKKPKAQE